MTTTLRAAVDWQRGIVRETEHGRLALWVLKPGFLILQLRSHGDKAFVEPLVAGLERALELGPTVQVFVDAQQMSSYDSELRTAATAAFVRRRQRIGSFHVAIVLHQKLVAMGVNVVNLALGGLMTIHREPAPFRTALETALTQAKVVGFSLEALSSERARGAR